MKKATVIGLGTISSIHLGAIAQNPDIELVGVCDIDPAKERAAPAGVPFFTDYREMLRETAPDVAHICLPHALHVPVAMDAAQMGVHVFLEKPMAINQEQGQALVEMEQAHPELHLGICLQNRVNETVERLKEIIDSGEYGGVVGTKGIVTWYREKAYYEEAPWRSRLDMAGGGCMLNQSIHTLDLLYYLGGEIREVTALVGQLLNYGIEVEDTVAARLTYQNGAAGLFFATIANSRNENVQLSVQLEGAEFSILDNVLYRVYPSGEKERLVEDAKLKGTKFYYGASHGKLIDRFYSELEHGGQNYLHMKDAMMSLRLIDAIQKAGRTGQIAAV